MPAVLRTYIPNPLTQRVGAILNTHMACNGSSLRPEHCSCLLASLSLFQLAMLLPLHRDSQTKAEVA